MAVSKKQTKTEKACDNVRIRGCETSCGKNSGCGACGGMLYGLGFIGAAIYFISKATGFWMGVLGFLKAIVWPVYVVYGLLKFLGM